MPTLLSRLYFDESDKPDQVKLGQTIMWQCSDCDRLFWLGRLTSKATITELHRVDADFRVHCKHEHAGETVVGLKIQNPKEDPSQAAARIVREATDSKD